MVVVFSAAGLSHARRQELLCMAAFAYYDKTAVRLCELLAQDLARFRRRLGGEDPVHRWHAGHDGAAVALVDELAVLGH